MKMGEKTIDTIAAKWFPERSEQAMTERELIVKLRDALEVPGEKAKCRDCNGTGVKP